MVIEYNVHKYETHLFWIGKEEYGILYENRIK